MTPISNQSVTKNLIIFATLSSSVVAMPYEYSEAIIPSEEVKIKSMENMPDWDATLFNPLASNSVINDDNEKIDTIIDFSQKVLEDSMDMDSEYVDIVNENFWDLI